MTDVHQRKRSESGSPRIQSPVVQDVIDRCRRRVSSSSSETLSDVVKSARRRSSLRRRNSTDELRQEKKQQHKPKLNIDRFLRRNASSSSKLNGKRVVSRSFANSWISDRSYSMTPTNKSKNVVIRRGRVKKRKKE